MSGPGRPAEPKPDRRAREAAALRDNLRKRKEQARLREGRTAEVVTVPSAEKPPAAEASGCGALGVPEPLPSSKPRSAE